MQIQSLEGELKPSTGRTEKSKTEQKYFHTQFMIQNLQFLPNSY